MLRNSLAGLLPAPQLLQLAQELALNLEQRPQELAPQTWVALANGLNRLSSAAPAG